MRYNSYVKRFRYRSVFFKMYFSYLLLIVVPVGIIGIASFSLSSKTLKEDLFRAMVENLQQKTVQADTVLQELNSKTIQLLYDSSVSSLRMKNINIHDDYNNIDSIYSNLNAIKNSNHYIHSIYIFFENSDAIISNKEKYTKREDLYDNRWFEAYKEGLASRSNLIWIEAHDPFKEELLKSYYSYVDKRPVITMVRVMPGFSTKNKGAIIINIYADEIDNYIFQKQDSISVIDHDNIIFTNDQKILSRNPELNIRRINTQIAGEKEKGFIANKIGNEKIAIAYTTSPFNGWKYVKMIPYDQIIGDVKYIKLLTWILCLILTVTGGIVSYIVSRQFYAPIFNILSNEGIRHLDIESKSFLDEFSFLDYVFHIFEKRDQFLQKNIQDMKKHFLSDLIKGKQIDSTEYKEKLNLLGFNYNCVTVVVLEIDHYKENIKYQELNDKIVKYLGNTNKEEQFYVLQLIPYQILLVCNIDRDVNIENLSSFLDKISAYANKECEVTLTIGIGNTYTALEGLRASYTSAIKAAEMKFYKGFGQTFMNGDYYNIESSFFVYPMDIEKQIINVVKAGAAKELGDIIDKLFEKIIFLEKIYVVQIISQILNAVFKEIMTLKGDQYKVFQGGKGIFEAASEFEYYEDLKKWCFTQMDLLIRKYREAEEFSNNKKYLQLAVDYIKENYIRDLGLNEVAEKVQLSPTYFSKIFKEGLNITFIDYINFLRIEKSKELIKSSEMTMNEVALKVGYNNDQSFTRYFKKYEGITPGQYRNSIKAV